MCIVKYDIELKEIDYHIKNDVLLVFKCSDMYLISTSFLLFIYLFDFPPK